MNWQSDEGDETVQLPIVPREPSVLPLVHHYAVNVTRDGETHTQYDGRNAHKADIVLQHYAITPGVQRIVLYRDGRVTQDVQIAWSPQ